jgi:hypothetical protein
LGDVPLGDRSNSSGVGNFLEFFSYSTHPVICGLKMKERGSLLEAEFNPANSLQAQSFAVFFDSIHLSEAD